MAAHTSVNGRGTLLTYGRHLQQRYPGLHHYSPEVLEERFLGLRPADERLFAQEVKRYCRDAKNPQAIDIENRMWMYKCASSIGRDGRHAIRDAIDQIKKQNPALKDYECPIRNLRYLELLLEIGSGSKDDFFQCIRNKEPAPPEVLNDFPRAIEEFPQHHIVKGSIDQLMQAFLEMLKDEDGHVRRSAAHAISGLARDYPMKISTPAIIDSLSEALSDQEHMVRFYAAVTVCKISRAKPDDPALRQHVPRFIGSLQAEDPHPSQWIAEALGNIADPAAIPAMIEAMEGGSNSLKSVTASGICRIAEKCGDKATLEPAKAPLLKLLNHPKDYVKRSAEMALVAIGLIPETEEKIEPPKEIPPESFAKEPEPEPTKPEPGPDEQTIRKIRLCKDLLEAAEANNAEEVERLISLGVDVDYARDGEGRTSLIIACRHDNYRMAKALVKAGADVDARSNMGYTALMAAANKGNIPLIRLLLKKRANTLSRDKDANRTAADFARSRNHKKAARLIENATKPRRDWRSAIFLTISIALSVAIGVITIGSVKFREEIPRPAPTQIKKAKNCKGSESCYKDIRIEKPQSLFAPGRVILYGPADYGVPHESIKPAADLLKELGMDFDFRPVFDCNRMLCFATPYQKEISYALEARPDDKYKKITGIGMHLIIDGKVHPYVKTGGIEEAVSRFRDKYSSSGCQMTQ